MAAKSWYYLSFAAGGRFLGACVVEADSVEDAPRVAAEHGINPGGEVMVIPSASPGPAAYRLLSRAELATMAALYELRPGAAPHFALVDQGPVNQGPVN